ncbi:MAG TPA: hypothetical protein ENJ40_04510 [Thermosulfurimonas dismutans]|uniref:DUF7718 domain-containing protein n=1 Tax=Thermosulfurimonas dismutans TaxID=999894 RepID=A0A7C3CFW7_9BACT|nr:hypothetical protein [Thermosulfurimonas dismutans]
MTERYFVIELDDNAAIHVWFSYHRGRVTAFAVKLLYQDIEIVRYDSGHGRPHKDILHPNPSKRRKVWYNVDNDAALSMAIMELKAEYQLYIERYLRWLAEEKQRSKG